MRSALRRLIRRHPGLLPGSAAARAAEEDTNRLSEPLSDAEILEIYENEVLTQEFYGETYAAGLATAVSKAADDMADAIVRTFAPERVLDVGCGLGQVVMALRNRGVDAVGCDYSETFLRVAAEDVRDHLVRQDVTNLDAFADDSVDLVMCMEVLEHLPVSFVHTCVDEMQRVSRGPIVVTTPSFGPNWPGRAGLPLDHPSWREDARAGRRFSQIVLTADGRPHHGHLTLAAYGWWTALFASHGLVRDQDSENAWLEHPERPLWPHRWNAYVLHEVVSPEWTPGDGDARQGGFGWYPLEEWDGRRVRWSRPRARLHLRAPVAAPVLTLEAWAGPDAALRPRAVDVEVRVVPGGPVSAATLELEPGPCHEIALGGVPAAAGDVVEVTLTAREPLRPQLLMPPSPDARELGVALRGAALEASGDRTADAVLAPVGAPVLVG